MPILLELNFLQLVVESLMLFSTRGSNTTMIVYITKKLKGFSERRVVARTLEIGDTN